MIEEVIETEGRLRYSSKRSKRVKVFVTFRDGEVVSVQCSEDIPPGVQLEYEPPFPGLVGDAKRRVQPDR